MRNVVPSRGGIRISKDMIYGGAMVVSNVVEYFL